MHRLLTRVVSGGATTTYKYDAIGSLITKLTGSNASVYGWSLDGKLTRIALPGGTEVAYVYDSKGNRVRQTVAAGSTVVTKQYIVDYSVPLSRVLAEEDADDIVQASYCYGNDLLAMKQDGELYYFFYDRLGSVRNVTDDSDPASTVRSYLYDAFGNVVASSGTITSPYQFTGEEYDGDPELVYLRARYYNPEEGRFISRDPLIEQIAVAGGRTGCGSCRGGGGGAGLAELYRQPQMLHPYVYCGNNPSNETDPIGLGIIKDILGWIDLLPWVKGSFCHECTAKLYEAAIECRGEEEPEEDLPGPVSSIGDCDTVAHMKRIRECIDQKLGKDYVEKCMEKCISAPG